MTAEYMREGNLVKFIFFRKQRLRCFSCSVPLIKDTNIPLALIDEMNSPKMRRVPAHFPFQSILY